ncbi:putative invertase inhibitor [Elaeis guineensis]|uniref:Invertase inhibitor n=1 Tax=Elaeis guineensis var. tenera TaxID=51953 RepID=A0A6I9SJZ2_ELAGV|nr:putative invertase inhibitor [Elaeis guineensis]
MRPSMLCSLLIFFLVLQTSLSASPIIEKACGKIAKGYVGYKFCVQALEADPKSGSANIRGLASISVKLSIANATSTVSKIRELLKKASDPTIKNSLQACSYLYTNAKASLKWSEHFIASKNFTAAKAEIHAAVFVGTFCEEAFTASPLTKENDNFGKLTLLATAIINSLA